MANFIKGIKAFKDGFNESMREEQEKEIEIQKKIAEEEKKIAEEKKKINSILVTTELIIDIPIEKRLGIISSECIFGINIVKDFFSGIRDIVGGNVESLEKALKDAKTKIIFDLKSQAYQSGADAIIAIKIEHTYNGNILSVFATGTIVKLRENTDKI